MTTTEHPTTEHPAAQFASVRFITADIDRLVAFYTAVTGAEAQWSTPDFAEFRWPNLTLAIGSTRTLAAFGDAAVDPASNRSAIVEFLVADVDAEHRRLSAVLTDADWVQLPTTMPWGNRSALLRDPDGTLVNLFAPPAGGRHVPAPS